MSWCFVVIRLFRSRVDVCPSDLLAVGLFSVSLLFREDGRQLERVEEEESGCYNFSVFLSSLTSLFPLFSPFLFIVSSLLVSVLPVSLSCKLGTMSFSIVFEDRIRRVSAGSRINIVEQFGSSALKILTKIKTMKGED